MIRFFLWHLFLTAVWIFGMGDLTVWNATLGFVLGYAILWLGRRVLNSAEYCIYLFKLVDFVRYFLWELLRANLRVAYDVLTPTHHMRPGIIALPLEAQKDQEITLLANLITLTPGTLSLDVSPDRKYLYVHSMYIDDPEEEKKRLKQGFERRLLELFR